jgi:hypothetical protein
MQNSVKVILGNDSKIKDVLVNGLKVSVTDIKIEKQCNSQEISPIVVTLKIPTRRLEWVIAAADSEATSSPHSHE